MGIFGAKEDDRSSEIEALKRQIREGEVRRKALSAELATERKRAADLSAAIEAYKIEAQKARGAVRDARRRQKHSVEKAKRLEAARDKPVQGS